MIFMFPVLFSGVGKVAGGGAKRREEELAPPLRGVNNSRLIAGLSSGVIEDDAGVSSGVIEEDAGGFWVGRALPSCETFGPEVSPVWFGESGGDVRVVLGSPAPFAWGMRSTLRESRLSGFCGFGNIITPNGLL
jgi:hypothetical protein